ncbi:MAG: hypothetical protein K2K63_12935 [Acetatifactor sp.]|nr:hypothetical protein [Acetatifactor sp.]
MYISGDCGAWIKAGVSDIDKGILVVDKYPLMNIQATGTEDERPKFPRGYLARLLHEQHDSDRLYLGKIRATIHSLEIRKKLAIGKN